MEMAAEIGISRNSSMEELKMAEDTILKDKVGMDHQGEWHHSQAAHHQICNLDRWARIHHVVDIL
jgi:hypothetical protein